MSYDSRPDTYQHIGQVRGLLLGVARDLMRRAHIHDASKLEEPERAVFDEVTPRLASSTYGSEEYKGFLADMGEALQHHYALNDHHPEHFLNGDPVSIYSAGGPATRYARAPLGGVAAMDLLQMTEMLCDWIAATRRHADGDILRSIEQNAERFGYGEEIKQLLLNTVQTLLDVERTF